MQDGHTFLQQGSNALSPLQMPLSSPFETLDSKAWLIKIPDTLKSYFSHPRGLRSLHVHYTKDLHSKFRHRLRKISFQSWGQTLR